MLALTIINPCCGAFRQISTSPFFGVQQFFLLPLSDKGYKEHLTTCIKVGTWILKEGGLLNPPQSQLKANSPSSGFTPYPVPLYLTSLDGSLDRTEVTDMGLQLPQTLTMLQQVSSGVSDHQRNRRLIRALLPETAARNNRLHMTGTQECSCPTCSLQLLNLPHKLYYVWSCYPHPLFHYSAIIPASILFTHHVTSFAGATEFITRPQERFLIFCKNLSLYTSGQMVSQKARMLVMNQVKRVTLPFSFPLGARARKKLTQMRKKKFWPPHSCDRRFINKMAARENLGTPRCSLPPSQIVQNTQWLGAVHPSQAANKLRDPSTTANTIWKCCTEAGECVPRLPQRMCLATQYWLLLIPRGGKTTLRVKNTFQHLLSITSPCQYLCLPLSLCRNGEWDSLQGWIEVLLK